MLQGPAQLWAAQGVSGTRACPQGEQPGLLWPFWWPTQEFSRTGECLPGLWSGFCRDVTSVRTEPKGKLEFPVWHQRCLGQLPAPPAGSAPAPVPAERDREGQILQPWHREASGRGLPWQGWG